MDQYALRNSIPKHQCILGINSFSIYRIPKLAVFPITQFTQFESELIRKVIKVETAEEVRTIDGLIGLLILES